MLLAVGFGAAALYHLVAIVEPSFAEPSPTWRHALFVVVNGLVAAGLVRRFNYFPHAFSLLTVQQLISHGSYGWQVWTEQHRLDWASVIVLVAMPAVAAMLWTSDA